ncbi:hypothetical protein [Capillimicrobium parvum]|uniref:Uncharacterized protein n=1 Tax=Capillimicrobium parvum TaxID=2884022 RepID=A0A9E7C155_9ACTN|nr:hypothetical protein [Capillimicrobium parvum]UGS37066.1 hypothetical protein DSM104329_03478 [Capillimicrobium parvum]
MRVHFLSPPSYGSWLHELIYDRIELRRACRPGARWLPCDRWVVLHWAPYDERNLSGMRREDPPLVVIVGWLAASRNADNRTRTLFV